MSLVVIGISHHTCPVDMREKLAFTQEAIKCAFDVIRNAMNGAGAVIISTCNRVEMYLSYQESPGKLQELLREALSEATGVQEEDYTKHLYEYADREAVTHLYRVVCGLDSLVVGEGQILGQVHDAYVNAQEYNMTDKIVSALFQRAFSVAKRARTDTSIGQGKVSISSVAVDLAESIFGELTAKTVMVIGSGEMGQLTLKSLVSKGENEVIIVNRNVERAKETAERFNGEPVALTDLKENLYRADIVISSTGAQGFILEKAHFEEALAKRRQDPMFVIDIAVPRDVSPDVNKLDNVYVYDIDDLQEVAAQNMEARREQVDQCTEIVEQSVEQFMKWLSGLAAEPTIASMSDELHGLRKRELQKTLDSLPDLTEKQREEVTYLTKRLVNSILQRPMTQMKNEMHHHDAPMVIHLVKRLFGIEERN